MTDAIGRSQFDGFLAGVPARSIDWEAPQGAPADLDMVEVLFGKGDKALEVAIATSSLTPKADDIRKLWNTRANQGAPVLLVVLHRDGTSGELRASVIGTEGDPAPLVGLSAGRVERIASIALDEPDRHQAVRALDRLLSSVSRDGLAAGLINSGLFAAHELRDGMPLRHDWQRARERSLPLLGKAGRPLLDALGFRIEDRGSTLLALSDAITRHAIAVVLEESESFDRTSQRFGGVSPVSQALAQAQQERLSWVVALRRNQIRLYPADPDVGVGRKGLTETFVELDLALLDDSEAGYLALLFSPEALAQGGSVDEIIHHSSVDAPELGAETDLDAAYHPELAVLVVASLATRLWRLFVPAAVVFDEIHFKSFAAHYLDGAYFYDVHPPLGKLLLAAYARFIGLTPSGMLTGTAVGMRVLPAVCGALLVPLVWGILRRFGVSRPLAFLGAFLVLADNALMVESRFILMDSMLMLFGLGAVYFYLIARSVEGRRRWVWWSLAILSGGAAASIKWTGLTALALVAAAWVWDRRHHFKKEWRRLLGEAAILVLVPALLYGGAFWLHFQLLPRTGQGDPFMTQAFQSTLIGNPNYDPRARMSFVQEFLELNAEMLRANQTLTATHPYSSVWYSWPFEQRGIYFWMGKALPDGTRGNIYLLGNPAIWWGVLPAIMIGLGALFMMYRKVPGTGRYALVLTAVAYAMNLVPFTGVTRVLFLYHYFFSFVYSLMFAIILWDLIIRHSLAKTPSSRTVLIAVGTVAAVVLAAWVYFLPLSYGTPLPSTALEARMWLTTWR